MATTWPTMDLPQDTTDGEEMTMPNDLIPHAHAVLSITPPCWLALATTLPRELLARQPAMAEWSAMECLRHLLIAERSVPGSIRSFLRGEQLAHTDWDAEGTLLTGQTPSELAAAFAEQRRENLDLLSTLTPGDLKCTIPGEDRVRITLEEMLHLWVAHDLEHTVQAERSLMQPFIAGSGVWRPSFAEYDVEHRVPVR